MDTWLDSADLAQLLDIAPRNARKAIARGHWRGHRLDVRQAEDRANPGAPRWQVRLGSLPPDVQRLYHQRQARLTGADPAPEPAEDSLYMLSGPRTEKGALRDRAVRAYLDVPGVATARRLADECQVHISQIYRWVDKARHRPALPQVEVSGEKVSLAFPNTRLAENVLMRAIKYLLDHPREPLSCGHDILVNAGENISYAHFTRLLSAMSPSLNDLRGLVLGNKVGLYLERTPKIIRAWLQLPAGHTLIGDQHLLDWAAVDPHTGETVLLQLYLWVDATSRYWMGLSASFGPYSKYTIGSSLLQACTIQIPEVLYTDWGRPERSGYVNDLRARLSGFLECGGWSEFSEKYPDQGIDRKYSTAGVPPVKPIEAQMNVLTTYLKQEGLTGYRKRDLNPFQNKQTQGTLAQQKRDGTLPTVPELLDALARVVERHNLNQCRTEEGPSIVPAEVLWRGLAGRRRVIPEEDLKLLLYPRVERRVRNASVTVTLGSRKAILTGAKLALIPSKETVAIYVNPEWPHGDSLVCRQSGRDQWEPYCTVQPWEYHGVDSQDADALREAMHIKQGYLKQFRDALAEIHAKGKTQAGAADAPNVIQITAATRLRKAADKLVDPTPKPIDRQAALAALADQILESKA